MGVPFSNPGLQTRVVSIDVARGVAIAGMVLVNAAAYFHYVAPAPVPKFLLHANWEGFLLADFVFPAFIVIVGVSIPFSLRQENATGRQIKRIGWRSLKLFLLGVVLSNLYSWYDDVDLSQMRIFGVLQRIGIVYFCAAIMYIYMRPRIMAALAVFILLFYTTLLYAPLPDGGASDLSVAGANIVSWTDRALLGAHAFYDGSLGYDPEGILSTLPALAQCLLGVLTGLLLRGRDKTPALPVKLSVSGAGVLIAGVLLGFVHPIIKDIWTASYVLLSSGITMIVLAAAYLVNDVMQRYGPVSHFFCVFGANAIAAYVLHFALSFVIVAAPFKLLYSALSNVIPETAASLAPIIVFIALNWLAMSWLWRRGVIIKI